MLHQRQAFSHVEVIQDSPSPALPEVDTDIDWYEMHHMSGNDWDAILGSTNESSRKLDKKQIQIESTTASQSCCPLGRFECSFDLHSLGNRGIEPTNDVLGNSTKSKASSISKMRQHKCRAHWGYLSAFAALSYLGRLSPEMRGHLSQIRLFTTTGCKTVN